MWFLVGNNYASRSASLKVPSAAGCGEVGSVGAAGSTTLVRLNTFHGLEGQWKGATSVAGEVDSLEAVVSSSEDSSLAAVGVGDGASDGAVDGVPSKFLRGDQPGGRRLLNGCRGRKSV